MKKHILGPVALTLLLSACQPNTETAKHTVADSDNTRKS
ncbi:MAG: protein involved in sex pheromone biosynthesis, partial [Paraglaciecola sp.]